MLIRLEDYEDFLVIEKEFPIKYEDCLAKEEAESLIDETDNDEKTSQLVQESSLRTKLPPISRTSTPRKVNTNDLIITKLQESFRNKLRI
jgi:hypothetical protein